MSYMQRDAYENDSWYAVSFCEDPRCEAESRHQKTYNNQKYDKRQNVWLHSVKLYWPKEYTPPRKSNGVPKDYYQACKHIVTTDHSAWEKSMLMRTRRYG